MKQCSENLPDLWETVAHFLYFRKKAARDNSKNLSSKPMLKMIIERVDRHFILNRTNHDLISLFTKKIQTSKPNKTKWMFKKIYLISNQEDHSKPDNQN